MDMQAAIQEAWASNQTGVVSLYTVEFRHALFEDEEGNPESLRFVLDEGVDHDCTLESDAPMFAGQTKTFIGCNFDLALPSVEEGTAPTLKITVPYIGTAMTDHINAAAMSDTPVSVTWRIYLNIDKTAPQNRPLTLELQSVSAADGKVTAIATLDNVANKTFPSVFYATTRFPGLVP